MRSKKALINSISSLLSQLVTIICGFVLPRLILSQFGSSYNGITSSITQFLNCVILLRAGVGGVTRAALYKPLADGDNNQISGIVNATQQFMKKVSAIFSILLLAFAIVYPLMVLDEFDYWFSFSLVIILGISTVAQNYFGITYQMLIQADQRQYIYSILTIATTILNTIVAAILILSGATIHVVKLGSAIVFIINPIILNLYVRKKYNINKNVAVNNTAISQRWDAFAQQVAAFVNNNTDVIVLTMFANIREVSVYTVYYMVANGLRRIEETLTNGIDAAFGNMIAKKEEDLLRTNVKLMEFIVFSSAGFVFLCGALLIEPFVMVYTKGIDDISYSRIWFGVLMCLSQYLFCVRLPYQMLVEAAGHFKQTRNGAIVECVLNIVISVILVIKWGLIGVTIGTFCALVYRTTQYAIYSSTHILRRKIWVAGKNVLINIIEAVIVIFIIKCMPVWNVTSYLSWLIYAVVVGMITMFVIGASSFLFYRSEISLLSQKVKNALKRR